MHNIMHTVTMCHNHKKKEGKRHKEVLLKKNKTRRPWIALHGELLGTTAIIN